MVNICFCLGLEEWEGPGVRVAEVSHAGAVRLHD